MYAALPIINEPYLARYCGVILFESNSARGLFSCLCSPNIVVTACLTLVCVLATPKQKVLQLIKELTEFDFLVAEAGDEETKYT